MQVISADTVASGASIKPGEAGEALHREALDPGDVPRPSSCRAAAPGPILCLRRSGICRCGRMHV